jgi:integrase
VERLNSHTAKWIGDIGDTLHTKLANAGLIEPREPVVPEPVAAKRTLIEFLDDHIKHGRTSKGRDAAQQTIANWGTTKRLLMEVFKVSKPLDEVTAEDAHQFRVWLDARQIKQKTAGRRGQPMAENAKRKHISNCKLFFNAAKRRGLITSNPFDAQVSGSVVNRDRDHYVLPENTAAILNAAPDAQWRLMIALWRLAGLRKMEVFVPTWDDVLWDQGKLRVRIPKTRHHEGCEMRYVPLRDIRTYLEDAFQAALPAGKRSLPADQPIITRFSTTNSNLDKPLKKIIEAAGLVPWAKLFHNLRASCETQWLKEGARADLVANWIGHSVKVQRENYVQHTEEDIEAFNATASKSGTPGGTEHPRTDENAPKVAHQVARSKPQKTLKTSVFAGETRSKEYPEQGSNRTSKNIGSDDALGDGGTPGGTLADNSDQHAAFVEQLKAAGFTGTQLVLIGDALRESGLQIVAVDPTNA